MCRYLCCIYRCSGVVAAVAVYLLCVIVVVDVVEVVDGDGDDGGAFYAVIRACVADGVAYCVGCGCGVCVYDVYVVIVVVVGDDCVAGGMCYCGGVDTVTYGDAAVGLGYAVVYVCTHAGNVVDGVSVTSLPVVVPLLVLHFFVFLFFFFVCIC